MLTRLHRVLRLLGARRSTGTVTSLLDYAYDHPSDEYLTDAEMDRYIHEGGPR